MTGQADGQAMVDGTPQRAVGPADSDTYLAAENGAADAISALTDPDDRSQLVWSLAVRFCRPKDYLDAKAGVAEDAIIEAIRARPVDERQDIITRAERVFPEPARICWSDLVAAVVVVVLAGLVLVHLDGLSQLDRGVVAGCAGTACIYFLYWFGCSVVERIWRGGST